MTDIVERLRGVSNYVLMREAADEIERLRAALTEIATFNDAHANNVLEKTGSWGAFDEPGSVQIARKALKGEA